MSVIALALLGSMLLSTPPVPPDGVCIEVDATRDGLSPSERAEAVAALTLALRERGLAVGAPPCGDRLLISTTRHGGGWVARVERAGVAELGRVDEVAGLMQLYPELVSLLYPTPAPNPAPNPAAEAEAAPAPIAGSGPLLRVSLGRVGDEDGAKGGGIGYRIDAGTYLIDIGAHGSGVKVSGANDVVRFALTVGASRVLLPDGVVAPYVGGGLGLGLVALGADGGFGGGLEAVGTAGMVFGRHLWLQPVVQVDVHVPLFEVDGAPLPVLFFGSLGFRL